MIDPNYISQPAIILRHMAAGMTGYRVAIEQALRHGALEINHATQVIHIQAGLGHDNFVWLIWRAITRLVMGPGSVKECLEFPDRPMLTLVRGGGGFDEDGLPYTMPLPRLSLDEEPDPMCPYIEGEPVLAIVRAAP